MNKLSKSIFLLFFLIMSIFVFSPKLQAYEREHRDFNSENFHRNMPQNQSFDRGATYGATRGAEYGASQGAAYGAAAGSASSNAYGVPVNPNAAEQNMLYYSGVQQMQKQ